MSSQGGAPGQLQVRALDPASGPAGSYVTLTGTGFSSGDTVQMVSGSNTIVVLAGIVMTTSAITVAIPPGTPPSTPKLQVLHAGQPVPASGLPFTVTSGRVFYLAPGGSDSAAGTKSAPWGTLAGAARKVQPGDVVYLRGGNYLQTVAFRTGGTAGAPVRYSAYPGETPKVISPDGQFTVEVYASYITLDHLDLSNPGDGKAMALIDGSHHIQVLNCDIHYTGTSCIMLDGDDNLFLGNKIHDCGRTRINHDHGMYVQGARNVIRGNEIYAAYAYGIQLQNNNGRIAGDNLVEGNYIHSNGFSDPTNTVTNNSAIIIGHGQPNSIIRNNRMCDNFKYAMYITDATDGTQVIDNVSCYNRGGAFYFEGAGKTVLTGNISYNDGRYAIMAVPGVTSDRNTLYRSAGPLQFQWNVRDYALDPYRAVSGQDKNSKVVDPKFAHVPTDAFQASAALTYDFCSPSIPALCTH